MSDSAFESDDFGPALRASLVQLTAAFTGSHDELWRNMGKPRKNVMRKHVDGWIEDFEKARASGSYKPFWRTEDVPSFGVKSKLPAFDNPGRVIHLLSYNERLMYYRLAFDLRFVEVLEQFPLLPLEKAMSIAKFMGIKYPIYQDTGTPRVITTDFMCGTIDFRKIAFQVKSEDALMDARTEERIILEKAIVKNSGGEHLLVTDAELRNQFHYNLEYLYPCRSLPEPLIRVFDAWLPNFFGCISDYQYQPLTHSLSESSEMVGISYPLAARFLNYGLWNQRIDFNWDMPLFMEREPVELEIAPYV